MQIGLQLRDLLAQGFRRVPIAPDDPNAPCVRDRRSKPGTRHCPHACEHDGVADLQQVGDWRADLLWR